MSKGTKYQYCQYHKKMEQYPSCATNYSESVRFSRNEQLPKSERPVVWEHPTTGEIRYPGRNDTEMPGYYKDLGYERKEFTSYKEHQQFNKEHNLVNHAAEDIKD